MLKDWTYMYLLGKVYPNKTAPGNVKWQCNTIHHAYRLERGQWIDFTPGTCKAYSFFLCIYLYLMQYPNSN